MQATTKKIYEEQSLVNIEDRVVTVNEVFRLQRADELEEAEERYLPSNAKNANAIILAAAQGNTSQLGDLVKDKPKTLLKVGGKTILSTQIEKYNRFGIKDVTVVRGFGKSTIKEANARYVDNDEYSGTKEVYSLWLARNEIKQDTFVSYGDIIFRSFVVSDLLNDPADIVLVADTNIQPNQNYYELVTCDQPYSRKVVETGVGFVKMGNNPTEPNVHGEFIGVLRFSKKGAQAVKAYLEKLTGKPELKTMRMTELVNAIARETPIKVRYVSSAWLDVNTIRDLHDAASF
ncbi:hypothetical protein EBR96_10510 [bacterium]|nr:hypothetical protein [bacterium]